MRLYIASGPKKVTISSEGGWCSWEVLRAKGSSRRQFFRWLLPAILAVGVVLPLLFISVAFLALEGATGCSSSSSSATISCFGLRFGPALLGGKDPSTMIGNEVRRKFLEAEGQAMNALTSVDDTSLESFDDLVAHLASTQHHDLRAFISQTKAMLLKMERKVREGKVQELIYKQLASAGIPKSMHCLSLRLAEEHSINALARSRLPPVELISRLSDNSFFHVVLLTDNILAALVAVFSVVRSSNQAEKMVFHMVTDKKTYAPMHSLFALNPVWPAVVEVKGLHQYDWREDVRNGVREMMEIHLKIREHYFNDGGGEYGRLEALRPKHDSLLNYLKIYLPELFPELRKILFLDDDVVVRRDLAPLWAVALEGKVNGAVSSWDLDSEKHGCLHGRYSDFLNFSNPMIFSDLDQDHCAWAYGLNIFDLQAWRRSNITNIYHRWLKLNREMGMILWSLGEMPPALVAFHGYVHPIPPSWHASGLGTGHNLSEYQLKTAKDAAVVHFSGPAKPWLQIGHPQLRRLWSAHVNFSNEFIRSCRVLQG